MSGTPYRCQAARDDDDDGPVEGDADVELLPVFAFLWLASIARVAMGLSRHEIFGAVATLALAAVLALPVLSASGIRGLFRPGAGQVPPQRAARQDQRSVCGVGSEELRHAQDEQAQGNRKIVR